MTKTTASTSSFRMFKWFVQALVDFSGLVLG